MSTPIQASARVRRSKSPSTFPVSITCSCLEAESYGIGQPPFEVSYQSTRGHHTSKETLKSAQGLAILHLGIEPGVYRYDIMDVQDSNYPSTALSTTLVHTVHARPSVTFASDNSKPFCLDSPLKGDLKAHFTGTPPFKLHLSVRKPASTRVKDYRIDVNAIEWKLDIPEHSLSEIGRHEVTITRVEDASGCEWMVNDGDRLISTLEVVESARIVPVTNVEDVCVGDTLDFLLQGKAPWTIE